METTNPTPLLQFDEASAVPRRRGLRLWRVEVLNWGTLGEDIVHGVDLNGGWLCITGRNGTGKSTLADAIVTAFPPANARILYNAAGGAKNTKERTRLTYLRGFFGHESDKTGRAQPSALRSKAGTPTAILLQFHEESSQRWVSLLMLGTFDSNFEEQWLHGIIESKSDLSIIQGKEDWDSRAKRLRKLGWQLTADPGPYRERLRTLLRIPSDKAITTFVRTVGLKDIGDVNAFIRGNMLDDVSVHERYVELTKHYAKQLEIDTEIETTKLMIAALEPLGELVPALQEFTTQFRAKPDVEKAAEWRANEEKGALLEQLRAEAQREMDEAQSVINGAQQQVERTNNVIASLNASEPAQRVAALTNRATQLAERRMKINERLAHLRAGLSVIGNRMPDDRSSFHALRETLDRLVQNADASEEQRGDELAARKRTVETLKTQVTALQEHIDALTDSNSHLPAEDIRRRNEIAAALNLRPTDLPYLGELLDVDSDHGVWRVALEKLFRTQARRMLVPHALFSKVVQHIKANDWGARVRWERVSLSTARFTMDQFDSRRAYARLRIKPGTPLADWLHNTLRTRFDHLCYGNIADYEKATGTALHIEGFVKDRSEYHEKRDDIRIRGPKDYYLGWDNEEMLRSLRADKVALNEQLEDAIQAILDQRSVNDGTKTKRDLAIEVLKNLPTFDLIDISAVNQDLAALERERLLLAKTDPEAAQVEADLATALGELEGFKLTVTDTTKRHGSIGQRHKDLGVLLEEIDDWKADAIAPKEEHATAAAHFFTVPLPVVTKGLEKWTRDLHERVRSHFDFIKDKKHKAEVAIQGIMSTYLSTFANEGKELKAALDSTDAFLARLRFLQGEGLASLQDRFRKYLEGNLALHVSQLHSELEGQVAKSERRIEEINKILAKIPWEESAIIKILPRPNPVGEIKRTKELFTKASAPLLAPSDEQRVSAFAAVKELIAFLADENVRKVALDARHWLLFAVELTDPAIPDVQHQRKFYLENTDGLSGGQKNKLSVTLLASALAFQYDVAGARAVPGTFRTVIIDEAFARLDSENARYALELFRKFDFQLVLVHPLDGTVRVAEDYVDGFLLATIRDNRHTSLTGLRIEQFKNLIAEAEVEAAAIDPRAKRPATKP